MVKAWKSTKKEQWSAVLRAWKYSGLAGAAYCRKKQISLASFYFWKRQLLDSHPPVRKTSQLFQPVRILAADRGNQVRLELVLKNGRVLRLYQEMDTSVLARMAQELEAGTC